MTKRRFDLIVFDWDGTLYDSTALIASAIQAAAADLGVPIPSRAQASFVIGLGLKEALKHAAPDLPESRYGEMADRYRFHYLMDEDRLSLFDGVEALLNTLVGRGHTLAIATGKSRAGLDRALAQIAAKQTGANRWFSYSRTADETRSKPHPLMLEELMAQAGMEPTRTLMIGDTTHDLQLAMNAGTNAVAVAYGAHDIRALAALSPLVCALSVSELSDWLAAHG